MKKFVSSLLVVAVAMFGMLSFSAPLAAQSYTFTNTAMTSPVVVHVTKTGVINEDVYLGQLNFTTDTALTIGAFCADLSRQITLGNQSPPLVYNTEDLAVFDNISKDLAQELAWLSDTYLNTTLFNEEAAQGAIWMKLGATVTTSDASLQAQMDLLADSTNKVSYNPGIMTDGVHQGFINGGVPEPTTWAMMLLGFGLAGAAMRAGRRNLANDTSLFSADIAA